jgi:PEP-CTERM motif
MNFTAFKPLVGIALAVSACFAQATTIDFTTSQHSYGSSFNDVADGFDFESNLPFGLVLTKTSLAALGTLTVSSTSGDAFDLDSLALADWLNVGSKSKVVLNYTLEDGTTGKETFTLDKKTGFQTFSPDLDDVASFTLTGGFQLDNLNVSLDASTPAVPEPGSMTLLAAGLGVLVTMARRRKA